MTSARTRFVTKASMAPEEEDAGGCARFAKKETPFLSIF
jgi:hypothetical protein